MKLYYKPGYSSFVVHCVLQEAKIPCEMEEVSFQPENDACRDLKHLNPMGAVPLLVDDGFVLSESVAILRWLHRTRGLAHLYPKGIVDRARCDEWLSFFSTLFQAQFWPVYVSKLYACSEETKAEVRQCGTARLSHFFTAMEARLKPGMSSLLPTGYSLADPYAVLMAIWAKPVFQVRQFPNYTHLVKQLLQKPSLQRVLEKENIDLPL